MQESRYDGSEVLTANPTKEQIEEAVNNPENKTVSIHKVGSVIKLNDGSQYVVQKNGSWKKRSAAEIFLDSLPKLEPSEIRELYNKK